MNATQDQVQVFFKAADFRTESSAIGFVGDGHWQGADVYFTERHGWTVVNHEDNTVSRHKGLALVKLDDRADADEGLNQASLACDLEAGVWLVDFEEMAELEEHYGDNLEVLSVAGE